MIVDVDGDVLGDVLQRLGPAQGQVLAFGLLHRIGEVLGALDVDLGALHLETLHDAEDPLAALLVFGGAACISSCSRASWGDNTSQHSI